MAKFSATEARDELTMLRLEAAGWRVIVIWECKTRDTAEIEEALSPLLYET
jgi:DNA mismatch endonuclease (patch repair protein)